MLASGKNLNALQQARERYEEKFFKLTVRLNPEFKVKIEKLVDIYGSNDQAIEYAINHVIVSERSHRQEYTRLEVENNLLSEEIERLKARIEELENRLNSVVSGNETTTSVIEELLTKTPNSTLAMAVELAFDEFRESQTLPDLDL